MFLRHLSHKSGKDPSTHRAERTRFIYLFLSVARLKKEVSMIFPKHRRNLKRKRFLTARGEYIPSQHWQTTAFIFVQNICMYKTQYRSELHGNLFYGFSKEHGWAQTTTEQQSQVEGMTRRNFTDHLHERCHNTRNNH